jgi:hypothetical protein
VKSAGSRVESRERATVIAAEATAAPGPEWSADRAADRARELIGAAAPRVLGVVVRRFGDLTDAEDAVLEL